MSEVTQIEIKNFQSHERTVIDPAPSGCLTVITGPSDSGKTAIARALKWVLYNQPQGDSFRRIGCDFVEVSIETATGHYVARRRTNTTNRYIVDGQTLEGFGNTVPLEVQEMTGVRPVRLGDQDILANIAGQLEPPFLGSSISAPAKAKVLGKLAGTEVIDQASRELGTHLYRLRQDVKRWETEAEGLEKMVAQLQHLPRIAALLEQLRELIETIKAAQHRAEQLRPHQQRLEVLEQQKHSVLQLLLSLGYPEQASTAWEQAQLNVNRRKQLTKLRERLADIERQTNALGDVVTQTSGTEDALTALEQAQNASEKLVRLRRISANVTRLSVESERLSVQLSRAESVTSLTLPTPQLERLRHLQSINSRLNDTKQAAYKAMGAQELAVETMERSTQMYLETMREAGKCPFCGNEIQDNQTKEVLSA